MAAMAGGLYTRRAVLRSLSFVAILFAVGVTAAAAVHARDNVLVWHALSGPQATALERLAQRFNAQQKDYRVRVTRHSAPETMFAQALALRRTRAAPHIVQIHESLTDDLIAERLVVPLWQAMAAAKDPFSRGRVPPVLGQ